MATFEEIFQQVYVQAFFIFALFVVAAQLVYFLLTTVIKRFVLKTETKLDDMIVSKVTLPITIGILFYGAKLGLDHLNLGYESITLRIADSAVIMIAAFAVKIFIDILIDIWIKPKARETESTFDDSVLPLIHRFSTVVVLLIGLVFVLNRWGINVGPLLAGLGIVGVAIAFALQNTLGNILSGIALVLDKNFQVGDVIDLIDQPGKSGTVVDIGFRSTKIQTADNEILVVPNVQLASMTFKNLMQPNPLLRVTYTVTVSYGTDPDRVKRILLEQLKKVKNAKILKEPAPFAFFLEITDFAYKFNLYFWVESPRDRFFVKDELNTLVLKAFKKANIEIPFPTQVMLTKRA